MRSHQGVYVELATDRFGAASIPRDVVEAAVAGFAVETATLLAVPIFDEVPIGALCLRMSRALTEIERERVEILAGELAQLARRLRSQTLDAQIEEAVREALKCSDENVTVAARRLGVSRWFVYAVRRRLRARECSRNEHSRVRRHK